VQGGELTLRGLSITGGDRGVGVARNGSGPAPRLELRDVDIHHSRRLGILVTQSGSEADLRDVVIRDGQPLDDGSQGRAIEVNGGADLFGEGLLIERNQNVAVFLGQFGTEVELVDSVIRQTAPDSSGSGGQGVSLQDGGRFVARGLRIEDCQHDGIAVGSGSEVELEDVDIVGFRPSEELQSGVGLSAHGGATVVARSLRITGGQGSGIFLNEAGTRGEFQDVVVADIDPRPDGVGGHGIDVQGGATLVGAAIRVERVYGTAFLVAEAGSNASLDGLVVAEVGPGPDGAAGQGLSIFEDGTLFASDVDVSGAPDTGVLVLEGGSVELSAASIHDSGDPAAGCGTGIALQDRATLVAESVAITDICGIGLKVEGPDSSATVSNLEIRNIFEGLDESMGLGILMYGGGVLSASDVLVSEAGRHGMLVWQEGTEAQLLRAEVLDTDPGASPMTPLGEAARGIEVHSGALLVAEDLRIERSAGLGLIAGDPGTFVELHGAVVAGTWHPDAESVPNGVKVQTGARLVAEGLSITGGQGIGLDLVSPGTSARISDSEVLDTQPSAAGHYGMGVEVVDSDLVATRLLVRGNSHVSFLVSGDSVVGLEDVEIADSLASHQSGSGSGLDVDRGAEVDALRLHVHGTAAPGAFVGSSGILRCTDCIFEETDFAGLAVLDGELLLSGGRISASRESASRGGGVGLFAWHPEDLWPAPSVTLHGVAFSGHPGPALYFRGPGDYEVRDSEISDSATLTGTPGALVALEGVRTWDEGADSGLLISGTSFSGIGADAILLDGSAATLDGANFDDVGGWDVYAQHCADAEPLLVLAGSADWNDCEGSPRPVDPALWFAPSVDAVDVVE
jgi:hypothetical protein